MTKADFFQRCLQHHQWLLFLGHLGHCDTDKSNPVGAELPKVAKESKFAVAVAGSFSKKHWSASIYLAQVETSMHKNIFCINDHNNDNGFTSLDHLGQYGTNGCNPASAVLPKVAKEHITAFAAASSFANKSTNFHEP